MEFMPVSLVYIDHVAMALFMRVGLAYTVGVKRLHMPRNNLTCSYKCGLQAKG